MCFPLFRRTNASLVAFEDLSPVLMLLLLAHCEKPDCWLREEAAGLEHACHGLCSDASEQHGLSPPSAPTPQMSQPTAQQPLRP